MFLLTNFLQFNNFTRSLVGFSLDFILSTISNVGLVREARGITESKPL